MKEFIEWSDTLSVGVKEIDDQHKGLINMLIGVLATLRKLADLRWRQVCQDRGLKWELIHSRIGPDGRRLYSLQISQGFRAVAYRDDGGWLRLLSLHPDHDSAYR
jgi:hypothetical protein